MVEIELKARVADWKHVHSRLTSMLTYSGEVEKNDEYWSVPLVESFIPATGFRLRLRIEPGKSTVTFKEKTYSASMEVNKEVEFGVDDPTAFREFLGKMSAKFLYRKRKTGSLWRGDNGIAAELVHVDGLGDYLEVETLFEERGSAEIDIEKTRTMLFSVIERCGCTQDDIEERPYSQLLGISKY